MKKLFDHTTVSKVSLEQVKASVEETLPYPPEEDFQALESCVAGYCNASTLYDSVATESYTLVDHKNRALFNAYAQLLSDRLGVAMPAVPQVSLESLDNVHPVAVNREIALEGWIGTLWDKIKGFFKKIYEGIKAFFVRHFTRLGRTKKALENMKTLLEKTDKNIKEPAVENYKGPLLKLYAGYGQVNANAVKQANTNVNRFTTGITDINNAAKVFSDKHLVDKDFFTKIKSLQEKPKAASELKKGVDDRTPGGLSLLKEENRQERSELKKESKSLGEIADSAKAESGKMESEVSEAELAEAGSEDNNNKAAKDAMKGFLTEVKKVMGGSLNTKLIGGVILKSVDFGEEDLDLKIELADEPDEADGVYLGTRSDLLTVTKQGLDMIKVAEGSTDLFNKINDSVMKNLGTIDNLVKDIDKVDPEKYGKYKKLVNEQVRERLNLLRKFFSSYNKVGKNVYEYNMQCCEGIVHYCVLSVKHFG